MSVEVLNESRAEVDEHALVDVARFVLGKMGVSPLAELAVSLVDVTEMERLHVQYMDEPGPTDVMAFPQDDLDLRGSVGARNVLGTGSEDPMPTLLGDVVLCPEVAARQAEEAGHSTADELALLTTHGVLHLLGYDHHEPDEHAEMFGLQGELLRAWQAERTTP
jgi:probable rRNA maturation factor